MKLRLEEIRVRKGKTQTEMAQILRINQSALSKLERRPDMYVSMLRSLIQAVGGRLELRAVFGDEVVEIVGLEGDGILADLRELLNKRCCIQPVPPNLDYNDFSLKSVDESIVTFQKLSNGQYLDIPIRRVAEVLPANAGELPVVTLKGSLTWSGLKRAWQFRSAAVSGELPT